MRTFLIKSMITYNEAVIMVFFQKKALLLHRRVTTIKRTIKIKCYD